MQRYILGRILQCLISMLAVVTIVFALTRLSGDPLPLLVDVGASKQDIAAIRRQLGLDQPVPVQYAIYVKNLVVGDFGTSLFSHRPVLELILQRLPATLQLGLVAMFFSILLGIPLGVYSAVARDSLFDRVARVFSVLGQCTPGFWLGIVLIFVVAVNLKLLPPGGSSGPASLILPAISMGYFTSAAIMRLTRSSMLDVLDSEYIKFARTKGVPEAVVIWRHAFKNAAVPVLTFTAMLFVMFLGGAVVTETVFAWPGLGRLILEGVNNRDYPIVQGGVLVFSALYLFANLAVDILYSYLNPKIRYGN